MKETELAVLSRSPLFAGISTTELCALTEHTGQIELFADGENIPVFTMQGKRLGVVLSGKIEVLGAGDVPLNRISSGGLFGVAALFGSGDGAPTRLLAKKQVKIFFLTEEEVETLNNDPRVRKNLLSFLCDRIRFLNKKVATFSAPDATEKAAMALTEKAENGVVTLEGGLAQLARSLDMGRASLYRALEKLERRGAIRRRGKTIEILSGNDPKR